MTASPSPPRTAVVVGNPRPGSRTLAAAVRVVEELTGAAPDLVVDLGAVGPALLDWSSTEVSELVDQVGAADLVVVASPTYKATYTGLLKLFLDRFAGGTGLRGVAVPLMLGGSPAHSLAPEVHLRPLLSELGASLPTRALYVLDHEHDQASAYDAWLATARPRVSALLAHPTPPGAPA
ncbi:FMN reductase [Nocardioides scoriae]|uniref:FMN reductase n=1 Tax=Nocardioides scoriae TaxID=642780 RepID=A0A1H1R1X5_9ACTN|nr:NAD(P)H-dependent oxidoreductase [Nocardioides scoriae]SDS29525.1 FMN reductase [Nocardioides scoriae]